MTHPQTQKVIMKPRLKILITTDHVKLINQNHLEATINIDDVDHFQATQVRHQVQHLRTIDVVQNHTTTVTKDIEVGL